MTRDPRPFGRCSAALCLGLFVGPACAGDPAAPATGQELVVVFSDLIAPPADDGHLEVWVYTPRDTISVGTVPPIQGPAPALRFTMPTESARGVLVTFEPAGDVDARPSRSLLLRGDFEGARAHLRIEGVVTDGRPLQEAPGAHSLFTTSNNVELGYPSFENAGLWLFTVAPSQNRHGRREVKLTPLRSGWTYEGWIVRQSEPQIWIPYGKFRPDELSLLTSRDDTGTGPFSGDEDFRNAGVEDVPGEEWTTDRIARQLAIDLPGQLSLPLALDEIDGSGSALWHHVITIEPAFDAVEGPLEARPFVLRPYRNPIGPGGPGQPRVILLQAAAPTAEVGPAR